MKGGVAAMIDAARVAREGGCGKADCDRRRRRRGIREHRRGSLVGGWKADGANRHRADGLQIGVGHKGFAWATSRRADARRNGSRRK